MLRRIACIIVRHDRHSKKVACKQVAGLFSLRKDSAWNEVVSHHLPRNYITRHELNRRRGNNLHAHVVPLPVPLILASTITPRLNILDSHEPHYSIQTA